MQPFFFIFFTVWYEETYGEILGRNIVASLNGPDVIDYVPATASVEVFPGSQILPTVGFRIDVNVFWRLSLHAEYAWSFGHRAYQRLYFDYTYQGVSQPTAEWYSDGTINTRLFGIGIKLWGPKNEITNTVEIF